MLPTVAKQAIRGFAMGAADIVPGVSGGTVALVLGIYLELVANVRQGAAALGRLARGDVSGAIAGVKKIDWLFVLPLLAGIGIAVVALSGVIETALHDHPEEMAGLFLGLIVASIAIAWRLIQNPEVIHLAVALGVGAALFVLLGYQNGPVANPSLVLFFAAGAVAICAMILPGISGSFLLLMLGMYAALLGAVHDRELDKVVVFLLGATLGLALFSSLLSWLLDRHNDLVLAGLVGLMVGSVRVLWPWPNGVGIISDVDAEVIDGTGLDWPTADTWLAPTLLAIGAAVAVTLIAWAAERRQRVVAKA